MKMSEENIKEDKIEQIESYIQELEEIIPGSYEEYMSNYISRAACERYFEKIIEAVVDLAFIVIREKELNVPKDENSSFFVLSDKKIISEDLAKELKEAKGMRNIIAHEYGKIDDGQVFNSVSNELIPDVLEFVKCVRELR